MADKISISKLAALFGYEDESESESRFDRSKGASVFFTLAFQDGNNKDN